MDWWKDWQTLGQTLGSPIDLLLDQYSDCIIWWNTFSCKGTICRIPWSSQRWKCMASVGSVATMIRILHEYYPQKCKNILNSWKWHLNNPLLKMTSGKPSCKHFPEITLIIFHVLLNSYQTHLVQNLNLTHTPFKIMCKILYLTIA